jgi:tripeptidyl-peptidase-1
MMGTTILYSSGDNGVAGNSGTCLDANGKYFYSCAHENVTLALPYPGQSVQQGGTKFNPSFPATCPFVTAVGATQINPGSTVYEPESACEQVIFSGGGFSNIFSMPSYQEQAVNKYLKYHRPPYTAEQFNNSGKVQMPPLLRIALVLMHMPGSRIPGFVC